MKPISIGVAVPFTWRLWVGPWHQWLVATLELGRLDAFRSEGPTPIRRFHPTLETEEFLVFLDLEETRISVNV